ncbi:response regulator [Thioflexithrix psekupsensis]|uniref:histidine kinase n=1 Tax=Thioflexithrix psekupsensis TaxID=1570016 RepID=A0A251X573_9GAMM|nr:response regulator [Thioflexithrix psekupsensis]OUD12571.1 hypothetical protein TPSD3_15925 [Thioflexithrix psekupsensis]
MNTKNHSIKNKILIVDDQQVNLRVLSSLLTSQNYHVITACSGRDAMTLLHQQSVDLILLDVIMPEMDGYDICRYLKSSLKTKNIPILFLSGLSDADDKIKAFSLGAVDFITKPFQAEEVLSRIELHLRINQLQHQLADQNQQLQQEIFKQQQVTAALEESQRAMKTLLSNLPGIAYRCQNNSRWTMEYVSEGCLEMTGYPPEAFIRDKELSFSQIIHPDDLQIRWEITQEKLATKQAFQLTYRVLTKEGQEKWLWEQGRGVYDKEQQLVALEGFIQDITERRQADLALQAAKLQAEAANHAKSAFLANMSHEFRTPLNGILGYTQILAHDDNLTTEQKQGIEIIEKSGQHLLTLINDILDISRLETGRITLNPKECRLIDLLRELADLFNLQATEKNIAFIYQKSPDIAFPSEVMADAKRLRQILLNLLGNAIKFTKKGTIKFTVYYYAQHYFTFQIQDTGCGIASDQLEHLFTPFQQDTQQGGTGLGLAISQRLVKMMGGELQVKSELNQGSEFWFTIRLPVLKLDHSFSPKNQFIPQVTHYVFLEKNRQQPFKLLIIDHHADLHQQITVLLSALGFKLNLANNLQLAIYRLAVWQPDLIFLDQPLLNDAQFDSFKQYLVQHPVPLLLMQVREKMEPLSTELTIAGILEKPLDKAGLIELLPNLLPLTWQYESGENSTISKATLLSPDFDQLKRLHQLAVMGNIRALLNATEKLKQDHSDYVAFCNQVQQLASSFDMERLQEFLENLLKLTPVDSTKN